MFRSANWISSLTVGLLLLWQASPAASQQPAKPVKKVDYTVQLPSDSDANHDDASALDNDATQRRESGDGGIAESGDNSNEDGGIEVIRERFPNGAIKIERETTQDAQSNYINHGSWKMFDQKGGLLAQGQFENDQRAGTWIRWYRTQSEAELLSKIPYQQFSGPYISQATFKNGQLDGTWIIYDGKKQKISQWEFTGGKRNGTSTWWYPGGKKMREVQYRNGDMDGLYVEYTPEGSVRVKETYQEGRKTSQKTATHTGGAKKSEGTYLFAKEIEKTPDDWWNCKILTTTKTGGDEKHGTWISWYSDGQKQMEGKYDHDVQVGDFTWWHSNGQKSLHGRFADGKQDGHWIWWYPTGQKSIRGEYTRGNPTGRWTWWREDGKVAQSADLSHSEGVVIDTKPKLPTSPETPPEPRMGKPVPQQKSIKR